MEECFVHDKGLYWVEPGEAVCGFTGANPEKGVITWYNENASGSKKEQLHIRYSQKQQGVSQMKLYNGDEYLSTAKFTNTGSRASNWKELTVPLKLYSGSNYIKLGSASRGLSSIDLVQVLY